MNKESICKAYWNAKQMLSTEKVADYNMIKHKILKVNHTITGAWQRELEDSPRDKNEQYFFWGEALLITKLQNTHP